MTVGQLETVLGAVDNKDLPVILTVEEEYWRNVKAVETGTCMTEEVLLLKG